jgi:dynein heavy chain
MNKSMEIEFVISDVTEKFRTLKNYNMNFDIDKETEAFKLEEKWGELVTEAKNKQHALKEIKKKFADVTVD